MEFLEKLVWLLIFACVIFDYFFNWFSGNAQLKPTEKVIKNPHGKIMKNTVLIMSRHKVKIEVEIQFYTPTIELSKPYTFWSIVLSKHYTLSFAARNSNGFKLWFMVEIKTKVPAKQMSPLKICKLLHVWVSCLDGCCLLGACSQTHNQIHSRSSKFNKAAKQKKTSFSIYKPSSFFEVPHK